MQEPTPIPVVAAVVQRNGRFLVGRRHFSKKHGGLWEFPGGKIDADESHSQAIARELREELALVVSNVGGTLSVHDDADGTFRISFVAVSVDGEPRPLEHSALGWFEPSILRALDLAPADALFVRKVLT